MEGAERWLTEMTPDRVLSREHFLQRKYFLVTCLVGRFENRVIKNWLWRLVVEVNVEEGDCQRSMEFRKVMEDQKNCLTPLGVWAMAEILEVWDVFNLNIAFTLGFGNISGALTIF